MPTTMLPADLRFLERGWLSSNSLLMLGSMRGDQRGAVLVDTGYCTHKEQTAALVEAALGDEPLRLIVNTHLHSDHCGGNAHLAAEHGCPIWTPPGHFQAARDWDQSQLSYLGTGQQCERFTPARALQPGEVLEQAGRHWQVHAAPGHDPHSLMLFEPESGVLMSADALWEHGFGIIFPELESGSTSSGFDEAAASLELIASLPVRVVVPGHGGLFTDVAAALAEARSRLDFFQRHPVRHARHAAKALIKYHLLEVGSRPLAELIAWLSAVPIHRQMWSGYFAKQSIEAWTQELLAELAQNAALRIEGNTVFDH